MRYTFTLLSIVVLIFTSCKKEYTHNATILKADDLLQFETEKGYKLLKEMPNPQNMSECDYAAWCLQYTRAEYILDKTITDDSIIRHAVNYYTGTTLNGKAGMSYFLLGKIHEKRNDINNAMIAFKTSESYYLPIQHAFLAYLYYDMASMYLAEENNDKAMVNFRKSYLYLHRRKDYYGEAFVYRKIAETMDKQNMKLDSIIHYYTLAQKYALQTKNSVNYHDISCNYAIVLLQKTKEYQKAKNYFLSAYRFDHYSSYYYNRLAIAYAKLNMPDSASYFLNKLLADTTTNFDSVATDYDPKFERGYTLLATAETHKVNGNYNAALDYYSKYNSYKDSLKTEDKISKVYTIEQRFDISQKKNEKAELEIENRNKLIILITLIISALTMIVQIQLLRIKRKKSQLETQIIKQNLELNIENKKNILHLKLKSRIESIIEIKALKLKLSNNLKENKYEKELFSAFAFNNDEWDAIIEEVNFIYNKVLSKLDEQFDKITKTDKIVIALIALGIDITDMCTLLETNKNTLYRRRNTIKERLDIDTSLDLNKWMQTYIVENAETNNQQLQPAEI